MKAFTKFKIASAIALLPLATQVSATDLTVPITFQTLPVITITEVQALSFGNVLSLTQASTCKLEATSTGHSLSNSEEGQVVAANAATAGVLSGACAGEPDGTPGIYQITSFASANITVSLTAGTASEIAFNPEGYVVDYNAGTPERDAITVSTDANVQATNAITANSQAGTNRVIIGGTVTNQQALTAGSDYTTDFDLDVVYQ